MNSIDVTLVMDEVRRLTGPNLVSLKPGSIADVLVSGVAVEKVIAVWQQHVRELLDAVGWQKESSFFRVYDGGASLVISSPIDALYASCDINEAAWERSCLQLGGQVLPDVQKTVNELKPTITKENNPRLVDLQTAAAEYGAAFIWDDDELSIGHGKNVQIWPSSQAPHIDEVDWSVAQGIPCALVTGTNGKSTSVRLASKIAEAAGVTAGITSTDFVRVGEEIIDAGDYSGPGGARIVLRDRRTEMAFLEVARGGILRRGLPVESADVALITNIAEDHLGEYGITTLAELTAAKFVVAKALGPKGVLVLNAEDKSIVDYSKQVDNPVCWFSLDWRNPVLQSHIQQGGSAVFVHDDQMVYHHQGAEEVITTIEQVPVTLGGTAQYNIANALGVIGLCKALQFNNADIANGLAAFHNNAQDNPGRGNQFEYRGARVFVDFAHNEHSMIAIVDTLKNWPARRRFILIGQPGDRSDRNIQALVVAAHNLNVDHWVVAELPYHLRGRKPGDVPKIITAKLRELGVAGNKITYADSVFGGAEDIVFMAGEGDLILLLALEDRDKILELLA